jgi:5-amino-6-(5-phosphoribosylamino)uracil reductase
MSERPYTLLSCAMSLDGYLDSASSTRLVLSNQADLDRVDELRAGSDAILVGASTVRTDNPRLMVRSPERIAARLSRGQLGSPVKVTVSEHGKLDPTYDFFATGDADKLVYCAGESLDSARRQLGHVAVVVDGGTPVRMSRVSEDLFARGVRRLMVEGGGTVFTQFLTEGLADELQLVVAPFFVGDSRAPRFVDDGRFPFNANRPATLADVRPIGDVVLLRYALSPRFGDDSD